MTLFNLNNPIVLATELTQAQALTHLLKSVYFSFKYTHKHQYTRVFLLMVGALVMEVNNSNNSNTSNNSNNPNDVKSCMN